MKKCLAVLLLCTMPSLAVPRCGAAEKELRWQDYEQPGFEATRKNALQAAEFTLTSALERLNSTPHPDDTKIVGFLEKLIYVCANQGKYDVAEQYCKLAIQFSEKSRENNKRTTMLKLALANIYHREKRLSLSEVSYRKILDGLSASDKSENDVQTRALTGLADVETSEAKYSQANAHFQKAIDMQKQSVVASGRSVESVISRTFSPADHVRFAKCLFHESKLAQCETQLREALHVDETELGQDQPECAATLNDLAVVCFKLNRLAESEQYMRRAVSIARTYRYRDLPDWLDNLSEVLRTENKQKESAALATEADSIRSKRSTGARTKPPSM